LATFKIKSGQQKTLKFQGFQALLATWPLFFSINGKKKKLFLYKYAKKSGLLAREPSTPVIARV